MLHQAQNNSSGMTQTVAEKQRENLLKRFAHIFARHPEFLLEAAKPDPDPTLPKKLSAGAQIIFISFQYINIIHLFSRGTAEVQYKTQSGSVYLPYHSTSGESYLSLTAHASPASQLVTSGSLSPSTGTGTSTT